MVWERLRRALEHDADPFAEAGPRPDTDGADYTDAVGPDALYDHVTALAEEHGYEDRPIRENTVDGTAVVHVGAQHTMDEFREHEAFYAEAIGAADAVMMEDPVGAHFYETYDDPHFFASVGELAADQDKPVYETDPHTGLSTLVDVALVPAGAGTAAWNAWELLHGGGMDDLATGALGAYVLYGTLGGHIVRAAGEMAMKEEEYTPDDAAWTDYSLNDWLQWGETDYRNVMMADNTVQICRAEDDLDTLVTFQGAAHTDKIAGYMEDGTVRTLSKLPYLPYLALSRDGRHPKRFTRDAAGDWTHDRI